MDRLTGKHYGAEDYYMTCSPKCAGDAEMCIGCPEVDKIINRLGAYEDTGLMPEEIDHLRDLAQAEQDGRLVVLPCSMENPVYVIAKCKDVVLYQERDTGAVDCPFEEDCPFDACEDDQVHVFETTIPGFIYNEDRDSELKLFLDNIKFDFSKKDIGKTVFLSREEAEAALEAQKGGTK